MTSQDYYSLTSYRPDRIPDQPASLARDLYKIFSCTRLPWGNTQDIGPVSLMRDSSPKAIRQDEKNLKEKSEKQKSGSYKPTPLDGIDFHQKYDHEHIRMAKLPLSSQIWIILRILGKYGTIILSIIVSLTWLISLGKAKESEPSFELLFGSLLIMVGPFTVCWAVTLIVTDYFPRIWFRPPKGPLWDLNRRTGLVTLYDYKTFKKTGVIGEVSAPFYEFDAYIHTSPDRQGSPLNVLFLMHRYRDIRVKVGALLGAEQTPQEVCALWDYLQNFMDTSRPLPDVPSLEEHRANDPITAEHDRKTGRNPRYWIDMDDETFKARCREMAVKIDAIDTFSRPNLMAKHVEYTD
ncbi:hypothetical protein [Pseudomonas citronellolis]|uniref:hypothetical protein n=1 Tax=Pseudomonas citronellolis TaxID=53408 RepID=UPI000AE68A0C|nr:hypothetical protein [Pseudomonas citronellolis]WRT84286.1 hypothetical protein VK748_07695 [Pseudomonas citronellolis]